MISRSWESFGISSTDSMDVAKVKYRALCKKYHPDSGVEANSDKFLQLQKAWKEFNEAQEVLSKLQGLILTHNTMFSLKRRVS